MKIEADNPKLIYSGRIDIENTKQPVLIYPCSYIKIKFTGNILKITLENKNSYWDNFLGCIIDEEELKFKLPLNGEAILDIPIKTTDDNIHEAMFFKRQDACHAIKVIGIEIEGDILEPSPKPARKMEVYGDSVSAGEVSEALKYVGKEDPEHNGEYSNSYYSYAWILARRLNAELNNIAQGGIALMDGTGWFYEPSTIGMETIWDSVYYNPQNKIYKKWNFENYIPQLVLVAIGQNDSHPYDFMKYEYEGEKAKIWRERYNKFLIEIKKKYPNAHIICHTTILRHDENWDRAISEVVKDLNDSSITQYLFKRNGKGTPGHLRIVEAEEMANELETYINTLEIKGWD